MTVASSINSLLCFFKEQPSCAPECWVSRQDISWLDNHSNPDPPTGAAIRPQFDHEITVAWSDGVSGSFLLAANGPGQWGPSNNDLAAGVGGLRPGQTWLGPSGDPADQNPTGADGNPNTPYGAYAHAVVCPGDPVLVSATATRKIKGRPDVTFPLAFGLWEGEVVEYAVCRCCGGETKEGKPLPPSEKWYLEGVEVDKPKCVFPCAADIPATPEPEEPDCAVSTQGPFCHVDAELGEATEEDIVRNEVFYLVSSCPGQAPTIEVVAPDAEGNLEPYAPFTNEDGSAVEAPEGFIADCSTLAPVTPEEPAAPIPSILSPEFLCATVDGVPNPNILATDLGPYTVGLDGTFVPVYGEVIFDECACGCPDCTKTVELSVKCRTYANPLTSGYRNWTNKKELIDLADEFGVEATASEMWVRITEFDCGGTAQPQAGQIFGPYPTGPAASTDFLNDLGAAVAGSCVGVAPSVSSPGAIDISHGNIPFTLVIQEGVTTGAGVGWFSSAQGFVGRENDEGEFEGGDFISSNGNGATTSYADRGLDDMGNFQPLEDCEK